MASGGMSCVKYTFVVFNMLFLICGGALLGMGLYMQLGTGFAELDMGSAGFSVLMTEYLPYLLMGVGAVVVLISLIGCCGGLYENQCMLCLYFLLIFMICLVEVAVGVGVLFFSEWTKDNISEGLGEMIDDYNDGDALDAALVAMQDYFECCGNDDASDYTSILDNLPQSCCKTEDKCSIIQGNYYETGCTEVINDMLSSFLYFCYFLFATALLQVVAMIFSCCLCCAARRGNYDQPI